MPLNSDSTYYFSIADKDMALPVELVSFTAMSSNNENILRWNTSSEINNDHFEIQRSTDAKNWNEIGTEKGHGTTNAPQNYSFTDATVITEPIMYYRLKQVDYNGAFVYSDIRKISTFIHNTDLKLFPNPAREILNIDFGGNETKSLKILNMSGQCIYTSSNENLQKQIDISSFASGMYILKVYSTDEVNQRVFCKE